MANAPCALLNRAVEEIQIALPDVVAIYRFGTWGTAHRRQDSDMDLAMLPARPLDAVSVWELGQELARVVSRDVDLIDLLSASTVMRAQIIAHGQRLYCANESACAGFEDLAFSAYARLNEERAGILTDIAERGRIHGG